jgi:hypothetical protein
LAYAISGQARLVEEHVAIKAIRKHSAADQGEERIPALQVSDRLA